MTTSRVDLRNEPGWEDRHCRDANPDDFYQRDGEYWQTARRRMADAAAFFCRTCPILQACRRSAQDEVWGMRGGLVHRNNNGSSVGVIDLLALGQRKRAG